MRNADSNRPVVLLTGFGPFPGTPENVSARLVRALTRTARRRFPDYRFRSAILHTQWQQAPARVAALIGTARPSLTLHFGVSHQARGFQLEARAHNVCAPVPDASGQLPPSSVLRPGEPRHRAVTLPLAAVAKALKAAGHPVSISNDAGNYLCNAVLYEALAAHSAQCVLRSGFVHIPADLNRARLSFSGAVAGSLAILECCLNDASGRKR